jgi:hypothetical protein
MMRGHPRHRYYPERVSPLCHVRTRVSGYHRGGHTIKAGTVWLTKPNGRIFDLL